MLYIFEAFKSSIEHMTLSVGALLVFLFGVAILELIGFGIAAGIAEIRNWWRQQKCKQKDGNSE